MSAKKLVVIGAGKRVQSTALPVLAKMEKEFELLKIFEMEEKKIECAGRTYEIEKLEEVKEGDLAGIDMIYMAITKESVPSVLSQFSRFDLSGMDLLIETPVLLFKHFCHAHLLERFRSAWVAEDCTALPCFDVVPGSIGEVKEVEFIQSAYKYHGLAALKTLLGSSRITRASRKKMKSNLVRRVLRFSKGKMGYMVEPRDYSKGRFILRGSEGSLTDQLLPGESHEVLKPLASNHTWTGFQAGGEVSRLKEEEVELMGVLEGDSGITARMEEMKRVGYYRLLRAIAQGGGAYPWTEALEDSVIDYYLDRLGFYLGGPFMSIRTGSGRFLLKRFTGLFT